MNEEPEPDYLQTNWKKNLIYHHSPRGHADRKIASLRRKGKKRYAKWGVALGLIAGAAVALLTRLLGGY